jgi:hypothetical protein
LVEVVEGLGFESRVGGRVSGDFYGVCYLEESDSSLEWLDVRKYLWWLRASMCVTVEEGHTRGKIGVTAGLKMAMFSFSSLQCLLQGLDGLLKIGRRFISTVQARENGDPYLLFHRRPAGLPSESRGTPESKNYHEGGQKFRRLGEEMQEGGRGTISLEI